MAQKHWKNIHIGQWPNCTAIHADNATNTKTKQDFNVKYKFNNNVSKEKFKEYSYKDILKH